MSTVSACYRPVDALICSMLLNVSSLHSLATRLTLYISILTTVLMCLKDQIKGYKISTSNLNCIIIIIIIIVIIIVIVIVIVMVVVIVIVIAIVNVIIIVIIIISIIMIITIIINLVLFHVTL